MNEGSRVQRVTVVKDESSRVNERWDIAEKEWGHRFTEDVLYIVEQEIDVIATQDHGEEANGSVSPRSRRICLRGKEEKRETDKYTKGEVLFYQKK